MRKHIFYVLSLLCSFLWLGVLYLLSTRSKLGDQDPYPQLSKQKSLDDRLAGLETRLRKQIEGNSLLLDKFKHLDLVLPVEQVEQVKHQDAPENIESEGFNGEGKDQVPQENREDQVIQEKDEPGLQVKDEPGEEKPNHVIPILLFACNRVTVNKALDLLITYRPDKELFPIIVTQDCGHKETGDVIRGYGDQIISIQQPDLSEPKVPPKEKKFKGYFKIARHYGWALNQTFNVFNYDQVVIVEDDLEVSPDFYEYFSATLPLLKTDPSLWCVSAWNDNGKQGLIDESATDLLYRTDFFPGLGWMITKDLWNELSIKWPRSYWDDWMREPAQRKNRACIRPEISRTKTFGKIGVSNGLFFEKHLKYIYLNQKFVPFTVLDLSYLEKEKYDASYISNVFETPNHSLDEIKQGKIDPDTPVRITYRTKENFKQCSKALGIMDDFKSGVPRMAYRGVISLMHKNRRVYLAPNLNWAGYNPHWA